MNAYNEEICWRVERIEELELQRQKYDGGELEEVEAEIARHEAGIQKIQRVWTLIDLESEVDCLKMRPWIEGRDAKLVEAEEKLRAAHRECETHCDFYRGAEA